MADFPSFFVLQAQGGGPFLGVQGPSSSNGLPGFLKFSESNVWGPRSKFAMERSKTGDAYQIHIKSCFNNKYLIPVITEDGEYRITASADKTDEHWGDAACTMFQAVYFNSEDGYADYTGWRFEVKNFMFNMYVKNIDGFLSVVKDFIDYQGDFFPVLDSRNLLVLPSQVSFRIEGSKPDDKKSDAKYLCSRVLQGFNYHRFESDVEVADPVVAHQLFPTNDGNYRIKDLHFGKFWRRSPDWILADADEHDNSKDTIFSFVKVTDKVVALRNLGNDMFIGGLTIDGKTDCLNAHYPTVTKETRLMVEERVLQRVVKDVKYRLDELIIYGEEIQQVGTAFATNGSGPGDLTISRSFVVNESATTSWNNSVSVEIGVSVEFKTALVPLIEESTVEMSAKFGYLHEWGGSETKFAENEVGYSLVVPPLTKKKATLMCTTSSCDLPFSYTQRDLLPSGEWVETVKDDGIYKGTNSYNFYVTVTTVDK